MCVCVCVCLSVCLSACLSVCLSACLCYDLIPETKRFCYQDELSLDGMGCERQEMQSFFMYNCMVEKIW